jgi:hypothetical protein
MRMVADLTPAIGSGVESMMETGLAANREKTNEHLEMSFGCQGEQEREN